MELLKLLSANQIVAQTVCFLVLLAILRPLLWKRVLKTLDDRKARIAAEIKAADDAKAEAEGVAAEYRARLSKIEEEAKSRIGEAISEGRQIARQIREQAEKDADRIVDNGRLTIRDEVLRAREELKEAIVDLAIRAAEKVIEEKLTEGQDRKLAEEFLKKLDNKA
jgi:F-type H+-transporting ATPase subunit b